MSRYYGSTIYFNNFDEYMQTLIIAMESDYSLRDYQLSKELEMMVNRMKAKGNSMPIWLTYKIAKTLYDHMGDGIWEVEVQAYCSGCGSTYDVKQVEQLKLFH